MTQTAPSARAFRRSGSRSVTPRAGARGTLCIIPVVKGRMPISIVALAASSAGCYLAPFVVPPSRFTFGGGYAAGDITARPPSRSTAMRETRHGDPLFSFRAAVHPLGFSNDRGRLVDVGVGYCVEEYLPPSRNGYAYHGAYLEVGVQPVRFLSDGDSGGRIFVSIAGEVLVTNLGHPAVGAGGTLAATIELARFVAGHFASSNVSRNSAGILVGEGRGEMAIGVQLAGSVRVMENDTFGTFTVGLSVRVPASYGVVGAIVLPR